MVDDDAAEMDENIVQAGIFAHLRLELIGFTHYRQMPLVKDRRLIATHIRFLHVVGGNQDGHALAFGRVQR